MFEFYRRAIPDDSLFREATIMWARGIGMLLFGLLLSLYVQTVRVLWKTRDKGSMEWFLLCYTTVLFCFGALFNFSDQQGVVVAFVYNKNFPGGPSAYLSFADSLPLYFSANSYGVISSWLADTFLLYRCLVLYGFSLWVIILPVLMFLANIAFGILLLIQVRTPDAYFWVTNRINFALPFFSLEVAFNVFVTTLIISRILVYRRRIKKNFGDSHVAALPYVGIVAIVVESSLLYAVTSLLLIGFFAVNSHVADLFLEILAETQVIAPILIVYRVATRRAWTSDTARGSVTSMGFNITNTRAIDVDGSTSTIKTHDEMH